MFVFDSSIAIVICAVIFIILVIVFLALRGKAWHEQEMLRQSRNHEYSPQFQYLYDTSTSTNIKKETFGGKKKPLGILWEEASKLSSLPVSWVATVDESIPDISCCKNNLACCDSAILCAFLGRAFIIMAVGGVEARSVSEFFVNGAKNRISLIGWVGQAEFEEIFNNRTSLYDKVFMANQGIEKKIEAVLFEFEQIITRDCCNDKYEPYYETSPLMVIGYEDQMRIQGEARLFVNRYIEIFTKALEKNFYE